MHKIKNLTNSPYDIETAEGIKRLPAFGEVTAKLSAEQIDMMGMFGLYEISEVKEKAAPRKAKD